MFFKLAMNNVKKSLKDFTIYFLTLMFGVCLFYVSNTIKSQEAMIILSNAQSDIFNGLQSTMEYLSIFCSVILGFLIIYANQFLIKRRKKELGVYMLLGMKKGKISNILVLETFIIGGYALICGLLLGVFTSQGLTAITAMMLEKKIKKFQFIFSDSALIKSIVCFGIIFIIIMIFNIISVSKYKLIDLLTAAKKNETLKVKKLWVSVILFILSAICFSCVYYLTIRTDNPKLAISVIFGIIGTFLFFFSLSGFLLRVIQTNKKVYFKGLNMFVLRQINSKITTTFISMTIICLILLVSITSFSAGAGLTGTMRDFAKKCAPYDLTITDYKAPDDIDSDNLDDMIAKLNQDDMKLDELVKDYQILPSYNLKLTMEQLMKYYIEEDSSTNENLEKLKKKPIEFILLSNFNDSLILQGKEPITLQGNEYAICSNYSETFWNFEKYIQNNEILLINGKKFTVYPKLLRYISYNGYSCSIILPDIELEEKTLLGCYLNMQFKGDAKQTSEIFKDRMECIYDENSKPFDNWSFKTDMNERVASLTTAFSYIATYIGIIFLIICSAILALQQLSESSDNIERYKLLRKLGTEEKEINKSIFMQIFIYFMLPISLAIVQSIAVISIFNNTIKMSINVDNISQRIALGSSFENIASTISIVLIYGGYMLTTYFGCKSIIKSKKSS